MEYHISEYADNQATVYFRWGYKVISAAYPYSGWNIDDITVAGTPTSPMPGVATWDGGSKVNNLMDHAGKLGG